MQFYADFLHGRGYCVRYIESPSEESDIRVLLPQLQQEGIGELHFCEVADNWLEKRIKQSAGNIQLIRHDTPMFFNSLIELSGYFRNKSRFFQTDFYISQRKQRGILLENGKPIGGKWSFDSDNRKPYPKAKSPPTVKLLQPNHYVQSARTYVEAHFSGNTGGVIAQGIAYPVTFEESRDWLDQFLANRFVEFGAYEDAIVAKARVLHHSVLTPMLNIGLLTPEFVVSRTLAFAHENAVPLNSLEGFIRQLCGWREFIRGVYVFAGTVERNRNFWGHTRPIPAAFWQGTTGILPFDIIVRKVLDTGYCHHIERLMVLGNFMLLCEFDPNAVYRWFMTLFIDAYDWVMVPNVYGMSQFADGGMMATKPYLSGSHYLLKMGDFSKGGWQEIWDGLFWRFLHSHRGYFSKNPRLGMLIRQFDAQPDAKRTRHLQNADNYLASLAED
jgi:deoxyribodipyrimidine photolyase-related protein